MEMFYKENKHPTLRYGSNLGVVSTFVSALQRTSYWALTCTMRDFTFPPQSRCALLGCYVASSGNSLPTFRNNLSAPSSRVKNQKRKKTYGTDKLSRNVGKELPLLDAK